MPCCSTLFSPSHDVAGFHPDAKKVALMELATRAGVEILLRVTATGVTTEPVAAVPALVEVLADGDTPLSATLAAIRALGRIGDASAESAIRQVLTRDDLDTERFLQFNPDRGNPAQSTEDARWQFELACAETLARRVAEM